MNSSPLHVHQHGDVSDRPLVILHGITGHGARWRPRATHLAGFRVIAPDLRGHGRSTYQPPWTLEQHAADVLGVLDACGLERAPIVGHSFGGAVALHVARTAPKRVAGLVLVDPAIGMPPDLMAAVADDELAKEYFFAHPEEAKAWMRKQWTVVDEQAVEQQVADHLVQDDAGRWHWRYHRGAVLTAFSEVARPQVVPPAGTGTLVVRPTRGGIVPPAFLAGCEAALGDDFVVADIDCGHTVASERPAELAVLIKDFLARTS
ncbi:putative hydrolase, alpha/beta fold LipV [Longimycelium tulufanense]|uniref:Putative hydrolase, alpha/beta fold LipV n=1 Tax=Longimycelium tulufanense TaxID=907463 RepID=A0A8J3FTN3_9PSEU|nr:alpha/beta hydrolase [Longimycelium tulufanense]GGM42207.1 putative hydrolase, alpha/beta fold LipV [Longimycelium tulufanense]